MAKKLYTAKDIEALLKQGAGSIQLEPGALLTPSARDLLRDASGKVRERKPTPATSAPILPDYTFRWEEREDPVGPDAIQRFFNSPEIETLKQRICDMGRRMWEKGYTDGNGGNLVIRVGKNLFLCTQTLISKGYMTPETICLVDWEGKQLAGKYKRTSEVLTHLAVFKEQPKARATCHAHPPHATAFAVAKVQPPTCMIPEAEVFLGQIGIAEYQTPGTPENAKAVGGMSREHHAILMANHGVITWGDHIEDAYWKMENTDAYCQTIWIAMHLAPTLSTISGKQAKELIELRKSLGMDDKRASWKECELCDNAEWQQGVVCDPKSGASPDSSRDAKPDPFQAEALVQQITDLILKKLETR